MLKIKYGIHYFNVSHEQFLQKKHTWRNKVATFKVNYDSHKQSQQKIREKERSKI